MSAGFDAYHKWLGILPKDQPPHHYRLLGLEAFESDPDVIETAADRQLTSLRRYQSGEHAAEASKLLNEVSQARLCLLKPESKQKYDAQLRQKLDPTAAFQIETKPEPAGKSAILSRKAAPKTAGAAAGPTPLWKQPAVIGGAVAACVLLIAAVAMFSPSSKAKATPRATVDNDSESDALTKASEKVAKKSSKTSKPADEKPKKALSPTAPAELAAGPAVNLLKPLDLQQQKIKGEITSGSNGILRLGGMTALRLPTRGPIPDDYRLDITTERPEGVDTLAVAFPCSGRMTHLFLDGWNGAHSGLCIDGRHPNSNSTTHTGMVLASNRTNEISIIVHPGIIRVACNGESVVDWKGNPDRLFADGGWGLPGKDELILATSPSPYLVSRCELTPLRKTATANPTGVTKPVDLLRDADIAAGTFAGKWIRDNAGLHSISAGRACIQLGQDFPEEYTLVVRTKQPLEQKGDPTFVLGFPAGESLGEFVFDRNDCCGLEVLEGRRWLDSVARIPGVRLKGGPEHEIRITVLKRRIALDIDGKQVLDWSGDFHRLSAPGEWVGYRSRGLNIGAEFDYTITAARLEPPQKLPEPPEKITQPVDLLKKVDTSRDAYWGDWTLQGGTLQSPLIEAARLSLPVQVPDEYTLTIDATKQAGGADDSLTIGLPMGDHIVHFALDCDRSTKRGLELDDRGFAGNATSREGRVFEPGKQRTLVCKVSRAGIQVDCDGESLVEWRGSSVRRMVNPVMATPLYRRPFVATWSTSYHFSRIELAPNPSPMSAPERPKVALGRNLIEAIVPELDSVWGDWKLSGGSLVSPPELSARLILPVNASPRYTLSMLVERQSNVHDFFVSLPMGDRTAAVMIDGYQSRISGIDLLDGQRPERNPTRHDGQVLPAGKAVQLDFIVTPDSLRALADGVSIINWQGDPRRLSLSPFLTAFPLSAAEQDRISIADWSAQFKISQIVFRPEATSGEAPPRLAHTSPPNPKPIETSTASASEKLATRTPKAPPRKTVPASQLQTVPHRADQKLLLILIASERAVAEKYCAAHQLNYDFADSFDMNRKDYSEYYAIISGSNMMDYWGSSEERKVPSAFDALDRWVQRGGHLIVCSAFNGRNSEHLQRYGIHTGSTHEDFFAPVPDATEVLLQGNEQLVPPKNKLRSACSFGVQQPHAILMYRTDGKSPVMTSQPCGRGRVTYTSVEPEFMDGQWFINVLLSWASRGGPVPKSAWPASASAIAGTGSSGRLSVPDQAEQREAKKVLRSIFKSEYDKIQQNAAKLAIAEGLLSQDLSAESPAVRYTAWNESKELAVAIGDLPLAVRAIRQLDSDFEVDGLAEQLDAINSIAKGSRDSAIAIGAARATLDLMPRLFAENKYDLAKRTAAAGKVLAQKGKDKTLAALAAVYEKQAKSLGESYASIGPRLEALEKDPRDAEANQKVGEFYCFQKEHWDQGLPYLAAGSDARTKSLAEMELAHPTTSKEQSALATAWSTYAEIIPSSQRPVPRHRAKHWWRQAYAGADGLAKSAIEKNLAKLPSTPATLHIVVDVDGSDDLVISETGLRWNHLSWDPPKAVQVNGQPWNLKDSTVLLNTGANRNLPDDLNFLEADVKQLRGRGAASIQRAPDHVVIHFEDSAAGGSDIFEVLVNFPK